MERVLTDDISQLTVPGLNNGTWKLPVTQSCSDIRLCVDVGGLLHIG